jgi:hypothetical protein
MPEPNDLSMKKSELTIEFAPLVADDVKRVSVSCDDVFAGVSCRTSKQNDLRLRN